MAVADKVVAKMREQGNISSGDLAEFSSGEGTKKEDRGRALRATTVARVPVASEKDPIVTESASTAADRLEENQQQAELGKTPDEASAELYDGKESEFTDEKVELTPEDKDAFIDAMVAGTRFERPFELFGGRVRGIFRSRTSAESVAILKELGRQWVARKYMTESEYSTLLRWSMIKAQLKELNGVQYAEMQEPLSAMSRARKSDNGSISEEIEAPAWFDEMQVQFGSKDEGLYTAVYREAREFERKYWALVSHAKDQNFWKPSQSTSV